MIPKDCQELLLSTELGEAPDGVSQVVEGRTKTAGRRNQVGDWKKGDREKEHPPGMRRDMGVGWGLWSRVWGM